MLLGTGWLRGLKISANQFRCGMNLYELSQPVVELFTCMVVYRMVAGQVEDSALSALGATADALQECQGERPKIARV